MGPWRGFQENQGGSGSEGGGGAALHGESGNPHSGAGEESWAAEEKPERRPGESGLFLFITSWMIF